MDVAVTRLLRWLPIHAFMRQKQDSSISYPLSYVFFAFFPTHYLFSYTSVYLFYSLFPAHSLVLLEELLHLVHEDSR